jgi:hypothetical protein
MTDNDLIPQEPPIMGEVLDYPDKCDQVDADGRIIHSPFCGLSEKLGRGENIWGSTTMTVEITGPNSSTVTINREYEEI